LAEEENDNIYTPAASTPAPPVEDGAELASFMAEAGATGGFDFDELNNRELDIGEKADDAEDYEDIELSDDDLADEELIASRSGQEILPGLAEHAEGMINFDQPGEDDDLFGDMDADATDSFPADFQLQQPTVEDNEQDVTFDLASDGGELITEEKAQEPEKMDEEEARLWKIQKLLFEGQEVPQTQQENTEELLKFAFPDFKKAETPYFNKLFPPRPGRYLSAMEPPKRKPIRPTKVHLEIEQDQKMLFSSPAINAASDFRTDLIIAQLEKTEEVQEESSDESDLDEPLPGGVTMQDLEFLCADFDTLSAVAGSDVEMEELHTRAAESEIELCGIDDFSNVYQARKKRRTGLDARDIVAIYQLDLPSFDDPERATSKLSRKVILDLNDSELLVEEVDPESIRLRMKPGDKSRGSNTVKSRLENRFKISNDAEYDLLKQNHKSKVRGQLGNLTIEHSTPALRLQYPYYPVKREVQELRNWHRKKMAFKFPFSFHKVAKQKRKLFRGKETKDIYATTRDLSLADNSTAILLEYSLEHPLMMSSTGMGSKVVNYYRRKTADDTARPKHDIGETSVLALEDKSPFHNFGIIGLGEEVTALYNSMYRAPIFEQSMLSRDFLVIRETTGQGGHHHYMRNVDHVFTVGQELPSTAIPGTHSRMVTTASKNRLKAISYRIARRRKSNRLKVEDVTKHFLNSTDMQNRQKMKEFMVYAKEFKEWKMKNDEAIPDEEAIKALIRPEDVCLLESMQVGDQYLRDLGYDSDSEKNQDKDRDDDKDQDEDKDGDTLEQLLAPWRTTKTFMHATQDKAMVRVWGIGDPSGRDEAFSFIRTNMKGGYQPRGISVQDKLTKDTKDNKAGSHRYNVAEQQRLYQKDIQDTWEWQKAALSSKIEPTDPDVEIDVDTMEDLRARGSQRGTPMSTPAPARQQDYETGTSFSKRSVGSQVAKYLRITRTVLDERGELVDKVHIETDPAVVRAYLKAKDRQIKDTE
jgi:transcription initiation factor TFIID subunit 1, fungi type